MLRICLAMFALLSVGCASYQYAQNVKTMAFSEDIKKGTSVGNVTGADCTWKILNYQLGGAPTIEKAFQHAQHGTDGSSLVGSMDTKQQGKGDLRYLANVNTKNDGFDAVLFGKTCIVVTGIGYK